MADGTYVHKRVFIGCPGGLETERDTFRKQVELVNKIKAKENGFFLEAVGWEDTLPSHGRRAQEVINADVEAADLVFIVFRDRWGQPTGHYSSGTEEEYEVAKAAGKEIRLFFGSIPDAKLEDAGPQLESLLRFRRRFEGKDPSEKALFATFDEDRDFGDLVLQTLCAWIRDLVGGGDAASRPHDPPVEAGASAGSQEDELPARIDEELAQELGETGTRLLVEARGAMVERRFTDAQQAYANLIALRPAPAVLLEYATLLERQGIHSKLEQVLEHGTRIADVLGDRELASKIETRRGHLARRLGALDTAEAHYHRSLALNEELGRKEGMAAAYGNLGIVHRVRGDLDEAEAYHRRSLTIDEELGRKEGMASDYGNLGNLFYARGDLDEAEAHYHRSLAIDEELGHKEGMANDYGNLGNIYHVRGDLDEAEAYHRRSLTIDEELGRKEGMASDYGNLGNLFYARGDLDEAEAHYHRSLAIDEELGHKEGMASDYANLGNLYRRRGDLDAAETHVRQSLALNEELGNKQGLAADYGNLGIVNQLRGDLEQAEAHYRRSLALNEQLGRKEGMANQYGNLGIVNQLRGDLEQAEAHVRRSLALNEQLGSKKGMAIQSGSLGLLALRAGDQDEALSLLERSAALCQEMAVAIHPSVETALARLRSEANTA